MVLGCVFLAVGENGDDDGGGAFVLGECSEACSELIDAGSHGVEECGGASCGVAGGVERGDCGEGERGEREFEAVVEEQEGETSDAGFCGLVAEEVVEARDGGFGERCHGAGAIQYEEDFGEVGVHGMEVFS